MTLTNPPDLKSVYVKNESKKTIFITYFVCEDCELNSCDCEKKEFRFPISPGSEGIIRVI